MWASRQLVLSPGKTKLELVWAILSKIDCFLRVRSRMSEVERVMLDTRSVVYHSYEPLYAYMPHQILEAT